ncbi:MAG: GNAT family N-acetyltransferase [Actinobacteria bacterium]|nr:GNAT family N-acetyltransferase [Actinomycetota bacterium]MSX33962.1 GNAT family N-acetyltransferase [Actinomycetota bacterium]MSX96433.1 GNAT family N-acetyltransferase [Actinomycetota bacterium]MSY24697.1 GNAT family N-acetyltransferase [Actinomycetota bacterium]MSZ52718.1 GNAT family N-acetyltransferase [Actinomycetota bacterium]
MGDVAPRTVVSGLPAEAGPELIGPTDRSLGSPSVTTLFGRRVLLRPLLATDFPAWREVRRRNSEWLTKWEPTRPLGAPDVIEDREAFSIRCNARQRERQLGSAYGYGIFVDGEFAGEINLSSVQRGPFQSGSIGYWIDESKAGCGYTPEALVVLAQYCFDELRLHRLEIAIVPRNTASLRVVQKLDLRDEGISKGFLEIDGNWEDHIRFGLTFEDWVERGPGLCEAWIS